MTEDQGEGRRANHGDLRPGGGRKPGVRNKTAAKTGARSGKQYSHGEDRQRPRRDGGQQRQNRGPRSAASQDRRGRSSGPSPEERAGFGPVPRRLVPPGLETPDDEPRIPDDFDEKVLPRAVRAELRGLPKDMARTVAGHMIAAGELLETDPELAYRHGAAARRRASRLPAVREVAGDAAYAAGDYAAAMSDYRAVRRMTGNDDYLPVIADCERALGRPKEALVLARESTRASLSPAGAIEMRIVEAGAREDLGELAEARRILTTAIGDKRGPREAHARLRMAYAELLIRVGRIDDARSWFQAAARLDLHNELHVAERLAELDGVEFISSDDDSMDFEVFTVEGDE